MNGSIGAIVLLALAVNPPLLSWTVGWPSATTEWRRTLAGALAAGGLALVGVELVTEPLLDAIDVSVPTFRLAVAVVVGLGGLQAFLVSREPVRVEPSRRDATLLIAVVYLLAPAPAFAAASAAADAGLGWGLLALAVALALSVAALLGPRGDTTMGPALVRLTGAAAVVASVAVGLDAARTV